MTSKGFTLIEILAAVIIITVLVIAAVPLYEKTIERSRMAEARSMLMELQDAKLFAMTKMELANFDTTDCLPNLAHLHMAHTTVDASNPGVSFSTKNFDYSLYPSGAAANANGVCAVRNGGDYQGAIFYYYRPFGSSSVEFKCSHATDTTICPNIYGLTNTSGIACTACPAS